MKIACQTPEFNAHPTPLAVVPPDVEIKLVCEPPVTPDISMPANSNAPLNEHPDIIIPSGLISCNPYDCKVDQVPTTEIVPGLDAIGTVNVCPLTKVAVNVPFILPGPLLVKLSSRMVLVPVHPNGTALTIVRVPELQVGVPVIPRGGLLSQMRSIRLFEC